MTTPPPKPHELGKKTDITDENGVTRIAGVRGDFELLEVKVKGTEHKIHKRALAEDEEEDPDERYEVTVHLPEGTKPGEGGLVWWSDADGTFQSLCMIRPSKEAREEAREEEDDEG